MVIDSSALIAILEKETEAELFLRFMYEADTLKISAVTYTETSLVLYSRFENSGLVKLDE
jgi:ribonuclease VapC